MNFKSSWLFLCIANGASPLRICSLRTQSDEHPQYNRTHAWGHALAGGQDTKKPTGLILLGKAGRLFSVTLLGFKPKTF